MSIKRAFATLAVALGLSAALLGPAEAFGDRHRGDHGATRTIHHHVYRPHYRHVYHYHRPTIDPYAYRYEPRGYYPYYASNYWVPARVLRERKAYRAAHTYRGHHRYRYYQAWGYPNKNWDHVRWHRKHHGAHRHHQW